MSYNPGVQDRSGEILGGSIAGGFGNLSQMLEQLSLHQEKKEEEEKMFGGLKKTFRPAWQQFGFGSQAEYDNADARTIAGAVHAQIAKDAISQHEQQRQLTDEHLQEMAGLRQARGRFKGMMDEASAPNRALNIGALADTDSLAPGTLMGIGNQDRATPSYLSGLARPAMRAEVSLAQMARFAGMAGLPAHEVEQYSQAGALEAKASGDATRNRAPTSINLKGRDVAYSPYTGAFQVLPDMSGTGQELTDAEGNVIPGWIMGPGGKPLRMPTQNPAQQGKLESDAEKNYEALLQGIDSEINGYYGRLDRAAKDKTVKPFPESRLQELQARRQRVLGKLGIGAEASTQQPAAAGPAVGAVQKGYRYNGKFPPGDKRAWEKVQ